MNSKSVKASLILLVVLGVAAGVAAGVVAAVTPFFVYRADKILMLVAGKGYHFHTESDPNTKHNRVISMEDSEHKIN